MFCTFTGSYGGGTDPVTVVIVSLTGVIAALEVELETGGLCGTVEKQPKAK